MIVLNPEFTQSAYFLEFVRQTKPTLIFRSRREYIGIRIFNDRDVKMHLGYDDECVVEPKKLTALSDRYSNGRWSFFGEQWLDFLRETSKHEKLILFELID